MFRRPGTRAIDARLDDSSRRASGHTASESELIREKMWDGREGLKAQAVDLPANAGLSSAVWTL